MSITVCTLSTSWSLSVWLLCGSSIALVARRDYNSSQCDSVLLSLKLIDITNYIPWYLIYVSKFNLLNKKNFFVRIDISHKTSSGAPVYTRSMTLLNVLNTCEVSQQLHLPNQPILSYLIAFEEMVGVKRTGYVLLIQLFAFWYKPCLVFICFNRHDRWN